MGYIQCPHCQKKYNASTSKIEGKSIRCSDCTESFYASFFEGSGRQPECLSCGMAHGLHAKNYAGQVNKPKGLLFPGSPSIDFLCLTCKNLYESEKENTLEKESSSNTDSDEYCMACKARKGKFSTNFAGQVNEIKGNIFPGNAYQDYLCQSCKVKLEGGEKQKLIPNKKASSKAKRQPQIEEIASDGKLRVTFTHPHTGMIRVAPIGISWTVLFFGFFCTSL